MFDCRRLLAYLFFLSLFICFDTPVSAHKVTIFAWVEGNTIYTQSKFSGGKKPKGALVIVCDPDGNKLTEGTTDKNGEFSFQIPKQTALKIILKASMGHMAEWKIPFEEITAGLQAQNNNSEYDIKASHETPFQSLKINTDTNLSASAKALEISKQEIKKLIDESLDKKLLPIMHMLADSYGSGPTLTEVTGGIGYIFGLVGVAMYCANRRKERKEL